MSWSLCSSFGLEVLGIGFDELGAGRTIQMGHSRKNIVVVDVDVDEDELERNIFEGHLTQSSATGLLTTQDHNLV